MAKSVTELLVGVAVSEGAIGSVEDTADAYVLRADPADGRR